MTEDYEKGSIFRQEALESASYNKFEEPLEVVRYRKTLTRLGFLFLFLGLVGWLLFGSIPVEVQGAALAISEGGVYNLDTPINGVIKYIRLPLEDSFKKGDLLTVLSNPGLEARAEAFRSMIDQLELRLDGLRLEIDLEKKIVDQSLEEGIQSIAFKIETFEKDIPIYEEEVRLKRLAAAKGLLNSDSLLNSQRILWGLQIDLEKAKADLRAQQFAQKKEYRNDEIIRLEERLRELAKDKAVTEAQLQYREIYSPVDGKVLEWFVKPGTYVGEGQLIARLEIGDESKQKIFYGYLPLEHKKIDLQAPVQIELSNINPQEYGAMMGHITQISKHAVSPETLIRTVHNQALIEYLIQKKGAAVYEVTILPERDSSTPSGYRWTSGAGPEIELTSGTIGLFRGVVENIRPLDYFLPVWWFKQKTHELSDYFGIEIEPTHAKDIRRK